MGAASPPVVAAQSVGKRVTLCQLNALLSPASALDVNTTDGEWSVYSAGSEYELLRVEDTGEVPVVVGAHSEEVRGQRRPVAVDTGSTLVSRPGVAVEVGATVVGSTPLVSWVTVVSCRVSVFDASMPPTASVRRLPHQLLRERVGAVRACVRCGGPAVRNSHVLSFRWNCTNCAWCWHDPSKHPRPLREEVVCEWLQDMVMVWHGHHRACTVLHRGNPCMVMEQRVGLALRDVMAQLGVCNETAVTVASVLWCAYHLGVSVDDGSWGLPVPLIGVDDDTECSGGWRLSVRTIVVQELTDSVCSRLACHPVDGGSPPSTRATGAAAPGAQCTTRSSVDAVAMPHQGDGLLEVDWEDLLPDCPSDTIDDLGVGCSTQPICDDAPSDEEADDGKSHRYHQRMEQCFLQSGRRCHNV